MHDQAGAKQARRPHPGFGTGAKVWVFRHGEVHEDFHGLAYGGMDVPLSAQGLADSRRLAQRFASTPFDAIVASTLQRARTLGQLLSDATGAPLELDAGLVEIDRGRWQGMPQHELMARHEADVAAFYADPWNWREHGGETDSDVVARAWPVLERALAKRPSCAAIACHYNVVRNLVAHAIGVEPQASFRIRIDLTAGALLHDAPDGWRLLRCNVRTPGAGPHAAMA